jgi:hypothetical protein
LTLNVLNLLHQVQGLLRGFELQVKEEVRLRVVLEVLLVRELAYREGLVPC